MTHWWKRNENVQLGTLTRDKFEDATGRIPLLLDQCVVDKKITSENGQCEVDKNITSENGQCEVDKNTTSENGQCQVVKVFDLDVRYLNDIQGQASAFVVNTREKTKGSLVRWELCVDLTQITEPRLTFPGFASL